jgi:hypothetical protein
LCARESQSLLLSPCCAEARSPHRKAMRLCSRYRHCSSLSSQHLKKSTKKKIHHEGSDSVVEGKTCDSSWGTEVEEVRAAGQGGAVMGAIDLMKQRQESQRDRKIDRFKRWSSTFEQTWLGWFGICASNTSCRQDTENHQDADFNNLPVFHFATCFQAGQWAHHCSFDKPRVCDPSAVAASLGLAQLVLHTQTYPTLMKICQHTKKKTHTHKYERNIKQRTGCATCLSNFL